MPKLISIDNKTINSLDNSKNLDAFVNMNGIFANNEYFWSAKGPFLNVKHTNTKQTIGSWIFGYELKSSVIINCVTEFKRKYLKIPLLIIGLKCNDEGMICIFEFTCSKILRTIKLPFEVLNINVISQMVENNIVQSPISFMDGVIAVGMACGDTYLLDLCLNDCEKGITIQENIRDEKNACNVMIIRCDDIPLMESHINLANFNDEHLAICLNECDENQLFILKGVNETVVAKIEKHKVKVTALHYCSQLKSLLIGYNFGVWQMWDLVQMQIIYTSKILETSAPITHFAVQEPCDDPRAFCYVWVVYGQLKPFKFGFSTVDMYALLYENKIWQKHHGFVYQDLVSCHPRFKMEFDRHSENNFGDRCVNIFAFNKNVSSVGSIQDSCDDGFSYCFFAWDTWDKQKNITMNVTLFDLNQWYKEQMPKNLSSCRHPETFIITTCVSEILKSANNDFNLPINNVIPDPKSLHQFRGAARLEEHYYPSSLSFNLLAFCDNEAILIKHRGNQKNILYYMLMQGPNCLTEPCELYEKCIEIGLIPLFVEYENFSSSKVLQREFLLNVALEQQLSNLLLKFALICVQEKHIDSEFNLDFFVQWAWNRTEVLTQNAEKICACLFDLSGTKMDVNSNNLFNVCLKQLGRLMDLFHFVLKNLKADFQSTTTIKNLFENLKMFVTYLEILNWSINVGLLPELPMKSYPEKNEFGKQLVPYPVENIKAYYVKRRNTKLENSENENNHDNLLFIDYLINYGKSATPSQKQTYPLLSFFDLIQFYCDEKLSLTYKHYIFLYTLLDILQNLDKKSYENSIEQILEFPKIFQISSSSFKILEAFWMLDHQHFAAAVNKLLEPSILQEEIEMWQHRILLKTLISNKQYNLARVYMQVKKLPILEVDDLMLAMSVFIAGSMLYQAYNLQKISGVDYSKEKILRYFFEKCNQHNQLMGLLNLPLTSNERRILIKYLQEVQHPQLIQFKLRLGLEDHKKMILHNIYGQNYQENLNNDDLFNNSGKISNLNTFKQGKILRPLSTILNNKNYQKESNSRFTSESVEKDKNIWPDVIRNSSGKDRLISDHDNIKNKKKCSSITVYPKLMEVGHKSDLLGSPKENNDRQLTPFNTPNSLSKKDHYIDNSSLKKVITPRSILKKNNQDGTCSSSQKKKLTFSSNLNQSLKHNELKIHNISSKVSLCLENNYEKEQKTPVSDLSVNREIFYEYISNHNIELEICDNISSYSVSSQEISNHELEVKQTIDTNCCVTKDNQEDVILTDFIENFLFPVETNNISTVTNKNLSNVNLLNEDKENIKPDTKIKNNSDVVRNKDKGNESFGSLKEVSVEYNFTKEKQQIMKKKDEKPVQETVEKSLENNLIKEKSSNLSRENSLMKNSNSSESTQSIKKLTNSNSKPLKTMTQIPIRKCFDLKNKLNIDTIEIDNQNDDLNKTDNSVKKTEEIENVFQSLENKEFEHNTNKGFENVIKNLTKENNDKIKKISKTDIENKPMLSLLRVKAKERNKLNHQNENKTSQLQMNTNVKNNSYNSCEIKISENLGNETKFECDSRSTSLTQENLTRFRLTPIKNENPFSLSLIQLRKTPIKDSICKNKTSHFKNFIDTSEIETIGNPENNFDMGLPISNYQCIIHTSEFFPKDKTNEEGEKSLNSTNLKNNSTIKEDFKCKLINKNDENILEINDLPSKCKSLDNLVGEPHSKDEIIETIDILNKTDNKSTQGSNDKCMEISPEFQIFSENNSLSAMKNVGCINKTNQSKPISEMGSFEQIQNNCGIVIPSPTYQQVKNTSENINKNDNSLMIDVTDELLNKTKDSGRVLVKNSLRLENQNTKNNNSAIRTDFKSTLINKNDENISKMNHSGSKSTSSVIDITDSENIQYSNTFTQISPETIKKVQPFLQNSSYQNEKSLKSVSFCSSPCNLKEKSFEMHSNKCDKFNNDNELCNIYSNELPCDKESVMLNNSLKKDAFLLQEKKSREVESFYTIMSSDSRHNILNDAKLDDEMFWDTSNIQGSDDSGNSGDEYFDAEQGLPLSSSSSVQVVEKSQEVLVIDSEREVSEICQKNQSISDVFNKAFVLKEIETSEGDSDHSEKELVSNCINFVYAYVCDKAVNTSFPYSSSEESDSKNEKDEWETNNSVKTDETSSQDIEFELNNAFCQSSDNSKFNTRSTQSLNKGNNISRKRRTSLLKKVLLKTANQFEIVDTAESNKDIKGISDKKS